MSHVALQFCVDSCPDLLDVVGQDGWDDADIRNTSWWRQRAENLAVSAGSPSSEAVEAMEDKRQAHTKKKAKKKAKPSTQGQLFLGRMKESQDGLTPRMRATGAPQDGTRRMRAAPGRREVDFIERAPRSSKGFPKDSSKGSSKDRRLAAERARQRIAAERAKESMMLQLNRETVAFEPEPEIGGGEAEDADMSADEEAPRSRLMCADEEADDEEPIMLQLNRETVAFEPEPEIGGGEAEDADMSADEEAPRSRLMCADEEADDEEPNRMNQRRGSAPDMSNLMNVTVTRDVDDEPGPHAEDEDDEEEQEEEDDEEDDEDDGRVPIEEEEDAPLGLDRARRIEIRGTGYTDDDDDDDDLLSMPRKARRAAFRKAALADRPTAGGGGRLASAALFGRSAEISTLSDSTDQLDEMRANTRGSDANTRGSDDLSWMTQLDGYDPRVTDSHRLDASDLSKSLLRKDNFVNLSRKSKSPAAGFAPQGLLVLAACGCFCVLLLVVWLVLHFGFGEP